MKKHIPTGVSLPTELYKKIEIARGEVSRSRYLLRLLEKTFEENEAPSGSSPHCCSKVS
jgi:metal-responsive CopG/Arc/MetJ family transcriptional regulator